MERSESIKHISAALGRFQAQMAKVRKDQVNPHFGKTYASLMSILDTIQEPLKENGLAFTQHPDGTNGLTTMLIHPETGEYFLSSYTMVPQRSDPQAVGSLITYARRYALVSILGLNIESDDDGNAATKPPQQNNNKKQNNPPQPQQNGQQVNGQQPPNAPLKPWLDKGTENWKNCVKHLQGGGTVDDIKKKYRVSKGDEKLLVEAAAQPA